MQLVSLLVEAL